MLMPLETKMSGRDRRKWLNEEQWQHSHEESGLRQMGVHGDEHVASREQNGTHDVGNDQDLK